MGNLNFRIWGKWLTRASVVAVATIMMIGAYLVGPAGAQSTEGSARIISDAAMAQTAASSGECFSTLTNCFSSDRDVVLTHHSDGDTSACTFKETVDWGDKSSTTKTFTGKPNGQVVVTFKHTYTGTAPQKYKVVDSISEPSGSCGIFGSVTRYFTLEGPSLCAADTEPSGTAWVSKFPDSKSIDALKQPFRSEVTQFIAAMTLAGIKVRIIQTLRPPERAYLLHYSWLVAKRKIAPQKVPAFRPGPGQAAVQICWVHTKSGVLDTAASVTAAAQMVKAYRIDPKLKVAPSLTSLHTQGEAIDMTTTWAGKSITIVNVDMKKVVISSTPRNGLNRQLIAVGATYQVIHFKNASRDPNHWSVNGR